jgi:hypothetical protein
VGGGGCSTPRGVISLVNLAEGSVRGRIDLRAVEKGRLSSSEGETNLNDIALSLLNSNRARYVVRLLLLCQPI